MRIVTRAEWSARPPKAAPAHVALSARTATCVHHDGATPVTVRSFAEACARIRADQNYHIDGNGWNDIGYNFLVISAPGVAGVDGLIFEGRGRDVVGAHCLNHNTEWIGIQVAIGGDQKPSPAALASVRWLHDSFETAAGRQLGRKVHSDGFPTACPGPELKAWVHSGMQVRATPIAPTTPEDDMLTPEAQTWIEGRMDAHDAYIIQNLRAAVAAAKIDPAAFAKAVAAALPATGTVTQPMLEAALRTVLGSVDGKV